MDKEVFFIANVTRQGGNKLLLVVERGEMIVPSLNSAFPKPKEEVVEKPKSYSQEVRLHTYYQPANICITILVPF